MTRTRTERGTTRARSRYRSTVVLYTWVAVGVALGCAANATASDRLSLAAALERSAGNSAAIADAAAELAIAEAQLRQARRWANPELSVEAENVLGSGPYAGFDAAETTVAVTQAVPLWGRRAAGISAAASARDLAQLQLRRVEAETARGVTTAFAEAVAAERLALLARDRARALGEARDAVERRFAAGLESELQRSRAIVEAVRAAADAERAMLERAARLRALARLWGDSEVTEPLDDAWFERLGATDEQGAPAGAHVRVLEAQAAAAHAAAQLEVAQTEGRPTLQASLGARRFSDAPTDADRALVLGFSMPLPLWDRNEVGVARARSGLRRELRRSALEGASVAADLAAARTTLRTALAEAQVLESAAMPAATLAADLARRGYAAGRLSLLERLAAERDAFETAATLERARLAVHAARADLTSLVAGFSPTASAETAAAAGSSR